MLYMIMFVDGCLFWIPGWQSNLSARTHALGPTLVWWNSCNLTHTRHSWCFIISRSDGNVQRSDGDHFAGIIETKNALEWIRMLQRKQTGWHGNHQSTNTTHRKLKNAHGLDLDLGSAQSSSQGVVGFFLLCRLCTGKPRVCGSACFIVFPLVRGTQRALVRIY